MSLLDTCDLCREAEARSETQSAEQRVEERHRKHVASETFFIDLALLLADNKEFCDALELAGLKR